MISSEKIKVKITKRNIIHYKERGYIVALKDIILIKPCDLTRGSHEKIYVFCDKCFEKNSIVYKNYINQIDKNNGENFCSVCSRGNSKKTCLEKYGVDNVFKNKEIQLKQKLTMIKKYGVITVV